MLGEEPALPYQRPPLSKGYIKGEASESSVLLRPAEFYTNNAIEVRLDCRVAAIDRATREVVLADGERVAYDSLVLATGARVRPLPVPGADLAGVVYVRTLADAVALKPLIEAADERGGDRRRLHRARMRRGRVPRSAARSWCWRRWSA